ncbi:MULTISPECIES: tail tape measure protein [unclassified Sphingobium]|uniref:tail tape measure protein n=1 Tax=unclassified Sphingobium TaxID=2611147 RepID=UPI00082FF0F2|nr:MULTISPECIES: tail tape measure protein [unclassified Sphingobium]NML89995.1 tail tape measure protein [Sphingobium sp. TB-6]
MDEEIDNLVVRVRADTQGFARDVEAMRGELEGPLAGGAERAGRRIEQGLLRAVRTGQFGFEELKSIALRVLDDIAASALRAGMNSIGGDGGLIGLAASALGLPGRATGGPVAPGRAYVVGERGPEVFVPTASGQVVPHGGGGARDVRVNIAVQGQGADNARLLARSARQVARAVRGAIGG